MATTRPAILTIALSILICLPALAEVSENLLKNGSFEEGLGDNGIPTGWSLYGGRDELRTITVTADAALAADGQHALVISDGSATGEVGLVQQVPATAGEAYQASVMVRAVDDTSTFGAYMQFRFLPSNRMWQFDLEPAENGDYRQLAVKALAPEGTTHAVIYLYTHAHPTPKVMVDNVRLVSGVEPPPPGPAELVPPQYDTLKDLRLETAIVDAGRPAACIVAPADGRYSAAADKLQAAVRAITGVEIPIVTDEFAFGGTRPEGNLIALGNRSTNRFIEQLYNQYLCLLDLKYPGPGGSVVRSLHNMRAEGVNVLFAGGSDDAGVAAATDVLIGKLREAGGGQGGLTVGRLMEIQLPEGVNPPDDVREMKIWEASDMYRDTGYFGWNSISKHMAMYYMTGREQHAREMVRLAFPDAEALKQITEIDGERIENKDDPLAGTYHYNSHMMILFWDLIEESPVFSDEERLRITNAFARQLDHRKNEGVYTLTQPPALVSSRHGQWSAVSLYCLGRYFNWYYPNAIWEQCVRGGELAFASLHRHSWVVGEADNLYWYATGTAPILTYMTLTGDRVPLKNGVLPELLKGQEILASGHVPDWSLESCSMGYLNKAAYLTGGGRWVEYRSRCKTDTDAFRLGQSYWPEESIVAHEPDDMVGKWSIHPLPEPVWLSRATGFDLDESFYFGSFRTTTDENGDFILIDGFNGQSRNPYHAFAILELRLAGATLLKGYRNQVLTRADGMVEPTIAIDAALRYADVVGDTAACVGEVPRAAFCNWRRTLAQRTGSYALVVDDVTFRADSDNMTIQTLWETAGGAWDPELNSLRVNSDRAAVFSPGVKRLRALNANYTSEPHEENSVGHLDSLDVLLLRAKALGGWLQIEFDVEEETTAEVYVEMLNFTDRGIVDISLDGEVLVREFDHYAGAATLRRVPLGRHTLSAGQHTLKLQAVNWAQSKDMCYIALSAVGIEPVGEEKTGQPAGFHILPCDVMQAHAGPFTTLEWTGPVKAGGNRRIFSLIGQSSGLPGAEVGCYRIADTAAALRLPQPAIAVAGEYRQVKGELVIAAEDHLYAHGLDSIAWLGYRLIKADKPVDVDWDFDTGRLCIVANEPTRMALSAGLATHQMRCESRGLRGVTNEDDGLYEFELPAGRHEIINATLPDNARRVISSTLAGMVEDGAEKMAQAILDARAAAEIAAEPLQSAFTANLDGSVGDMLVVQTEQGPLTYVAAGDTLHVLDAAGKTLRTMEADGRIRVLCWWPENRLMLAGCVDEQVIAFDEQGQRKWVFTSKMDPAVFRAAKDYWFKSAPGHAGIHGLLTGEFIDGKQQAFVGSACTLEIIDGDGQLVKRMPIFWGPGRRFALIDAPDGSKNLLIARQPTDSERLAVVNSVTGKEAGRSFHGVPEGYTYIGAWAAMSRDHIFHTDLDGDGQKEVVSEINGVWNRVTVWNEAGQALYSTDFGPGENIPYRNMRDLDVADLDGDGRQEIITATSAGLLVVLDYQCRKLWSVSLPSPASVLKAITPQGAQRPVIYVGCDGGQVLVIDGTGAITHIGAIDGTPTSIGEATLPGIGPVAVIAAGRGQVKAFGL